MAQLKCKACGYIIDEKKLGDVCPACGVPRKAFEPWTDDMSPRRRTLLTLNLHPIALHFPQAFSAMIPVFILAGLLLPLPFGFEVSQAVRLLSPGGRAYFSTYSPKFWDYRLAWFQEQARKGLLGEIDMEKTGNGIIVCKDGFTATTFGRSELERLGEISGLPFVVEEADGSSIFLTITKEGGCRKNA